MELLKLLLEHLTGLSLFIFSISVLLIVIFNKKSLSKLLDRLSRVGIKGGNTEFSMETTGLTTAESIEEKSDKNKDSKKVPEMEPETKREIESNEHNKMVPQDDGIKTENLSEIDYLMDVRMRIYQKLEDKKTNEAEDIYKSARQNLKDRNELDYRKLEVFFIYLKYIFGHVTRDKLMEFRNDPLLEKYALELSVYAARYLKDEISARDCSNEILSKYTDNDSKIVAYEGLIFFYLSVGKKETEDYIVKIYQQNEGNTEIQLMLLEKLIDINRDNHALRSLLSEKYISLSASNSDQIFNAAYSYSSLGLNLLSLAHYKNLILIDENNSGALNNLGVAYERLGMRYMSSIYYKKASENNNTLGAANYANGLYSIRYLDEAEEYLKEHVKIDSSHENAFNLLKNIKTEKDKEKEESAKYDEKALRLRNRIKVIADRNISVPYTEEIFGNWILGNTEIKFTKFDDKITKYSIITDGEVYKGDVTVLYSVFYLTIGNKAGNFSLPDTNISSGNIVFCYVESINELKVVIIDGIEFIERYFVRI
ncbi:tetratricopeptide repeat protein [Deinococcus roseus]|uniref:Tetratricopeptide repeat protein n=1 Tax=Deinococcus roseus TaxID=392414 RepID=A0ABQ2DEP8_9DEIO|nr:hypothetical protein [Deinococcus roseus]GGJ53123.1 hypothetical protein GCM10008938_43890 [Deinococcus roseus]